MDTMKTINSIDMAIYQFKDSSHKHGVATETGNYKLGNKYYKDIISAIDYLKKSNAINVLEMLLSDSSIGVRLWAASYMLAVDEECAVNTLEDIIKTDGIHSLTAETTLSEWRDGNLNL